MNMRDRQYRQMSLSLVAVASVALLSACADKTGSEGWCETMSAKSKSEWTGDEAKNYAAHCVLDSTTIGSSRGCSLLIARYCCIMGVCVAEGASLMGEL